MCQATLCTHRHQRTDASWVLALRSHGGPFVGHWPLGPHRLCSPPAHGLLALWARASPLALSLGTAPAAWAHPTPLPYPAQNPHSASKRFPQGRETSAATRVSPGALPERSDLCPPTPASQALGPPDSCSFQPPPIAQHTPQAMLFLTATACESDKRGVGGGPREISGSRFRPSEPLTPGI